VGSADAVATGRLNLACEPSDVALELHKVGVVICESLLEALATQLAPFDFGGIGRPLPRVVTLVCCAVSQAATTATMAASRAARSASGHSARSSATLLRSISSLVSAPERGVVQGRVEGIGFPV
jgi:hypothetical protein